MGPVSRYPSAALVCRPRFAVSVVVFAVVSAAVCRRRFRWSSRCRCRCRSFRRSWFSLLLSFLLSCVNWYWSSLPLSSFSSFLVWLLLLLWFLLQFLALVFVFVLAVATAVVFILGFESLSLFHAKQVIDFFPFPAL